MLHILIYIAVFKSTSTQESHRVHSTVEEEEQ